MFRPDVWKSMIRGSLENFIGSTPDFLFLAVIISAAGFLLSRTRPRGWERIAVFWVAILLGIRYFLWRGFFTLNGDSPAALGLSAGLLVAEGFAFWAVFSFFFLSGKNGGLSPAFKTKKNVSSGSNPPVDILVLVRGHSPEDLYRSLVGCVALDYPGERKKIYVLTSKDRPEIREVVRDKGFGYFVFPEGNGINGWRRELNKELGGEMVLLLEAGDVPVSSLLQEASPEFNDPKTGYIQCGFRFSGTDSFQRALFLTTEISHEQEVFNRVVQDGLSRFGAALAFGSGVIFRKKALDLLKEEELFGLERGLKTAYNFHRLGYRSVFCGNSIVVRTTDEEPNPLFKERFKRVRDAASLLFRGVPLLSPGLSAGKRLAYFFLISIEMLFITRILFLLAPLAFFIGPAPIRADTVELLLCFPPYFLWMFVFRHQAYRGFRHPLWSGVYETADVGSALDGGFRGFGEGPGAGGKGKKMRSPVFPFFLMAEVQALGLLVGSSLFFVGVLEFQTFLIGAIWAVFNCHLISAAAGSARVSNRKRRAPRLPRSVPCSIKTPEGDLKGHVVDINEDGISGTLEKPVILPALVTLEIGTNPSIRISGEVRRNETFPWGGASVGLRFVSLPENQKFELIKWLYCNPEDWGKTPFPMRTQWGPLFGLITAPGRIMVDARTLHRTSPRYQVTAPCRIILPDRVLAGETIDAGSTGLSLLVNEDPGPLVRDIRLELRVSDQDETLTARAVWTRHLKNRWEIGIQYREGRGQKILEKLLPKAKVKFVPRQSLHARAFRSMFHAGAFSLSLGLAFTAFVFFLHETGLKILTQELNFQTAYGFFWALFFLIFVDGIKVYIEVSNRAMPRRYHSDLSQVTAVIPCRNTGKAIEYTIEGLRRILKSNQILVVDDASTDGTPDIARRMGVRVIALEENVGKPRALGIGFDAVRTRYTLILDDDSRIQSLFLPTSLLEEGNTGVAFYVLPCRRTRENYDGKQFVSCLQRYEYAKSMEIGKRFQDKSLSVNCISGAIGLFRTDRLRSLQPLHSSIFPGEDLERTLIDLTHGGRIAFVNEPVWTLCPDNWRDLTRQRLIGWNPGFFRLAGYYWKILKDRSMPGRLRWEMLYNFYVMFSDPFKIISFAGLLAHQYWLGLGFLYFFYLSLEVYPFLTVEKKLPVLRYYLPALFFYPFYGIYNVFLRFGALFYWLWHRYGTKKWKPRSASFASG